MDKVYLNVGGTLFETFQDTLTQTSKYFEAMFQNVWKKKGTKENPIFIDRSSKNFEHILSFCRDHSHKIPPSLRYECDFYQIEYNQEHKHPTLFDIVKHGDETESTQSSRKFMRQAECENNSAAWKAVNIYAIASGGINIYKNRGFDYKDLHGSIQLAKKKMEYEDGKWKLHLSPSSVFIYDINVIFLFDKDDMPNRNEILKEFKLINHNIKDECLNSTDEYMFKHIHSNPNKIMYDEYMEKSTGEIIMSFPNTLHQVKPYSCDATVVCQDDVIPNEIHIMYKALIIHPNIMKKLYYEENPVRSEYISYDYSADKKDINHRFEGIMINDGDSAVQDFYFMVTDENDEPIPIKSIKFGSHNGIGYLIDHMSERQLMNEMIQRGICPNTYVYFITLAPYHIGLGRISSDDKVWWIELYEEHKIKFHVIMKRYF